MAASSVGISWLMLLLMGAGSPMNLPLSLPPLPADPVLASVAPEQCIWYMSLAGVDRAKADSQNQVEQLLAEEDVRNFCRAVVKQIKDSIAAGQPNDPFGMAKDGPKLVETLLTQPICIYLGAITPTANGPSVRGGLVVNLGDDAATTEAILTKFLSQIQPVGPGAVSTPAADAANGWHKIPMPAQFPKTQWGVKDGYLIVGVGEGEAAAIWDRHTKPAPKWLDEVRDQLKIERPAMVQYLNLQAVEGMLQMALTVVQGPEQAADSLNTFGMTNAKYFASVCGLDKTGFASRAILATDGAPKGWLSILSDKPLDVETLRTIPADATFAIAARVEPVKFGETILDLMAAIAPREQLVGQQPNGVKTREVLNQQLNMMAGAIGFHPIKDLGGSLGNTWCIYDSPTETGMFTGITMVGTVKNAQKLRQINDQFVAQQAQARALTLTGPTIVDFEYRGEKVYFLSFALNDGSPVSPTWCITADHLVIGMYPQAIKAYLDRRTMDGKRDSTAGPLTPALSPGERETRRASLADVAAVAAEFNGGSTPTVLTYVDTPSLFKLAYPAVQVLAQYGFSELQSQGIDMNISVLPAASAITPHLVPDVTSITSSNDGIRIDSRGSLPMQTAAIPAAALFGLRSAPMARGAAAEVSSMNNLKQIGLAMMMYEDQNRTLPPAVVKSKDGKPLLSWRVMILPYIEEGALYNEFHLDEPWDSEHNKALIEKMPKIYSAPGSKVAGEFKTVYQTVRGDSTAFPADQAIKFASITDGTSRTVAAVETSDEKAVVWTKPDDFELNEKDPASGLGGLRRGQFLALFTDAHVERIPRNATPESVKAIFTRNGGEMIDPSNMPRRAVQPAAAPAH